jgi:GntR family phosphonate transport system transcriptional regulator
VSARHADAADLADLRLSPGSIVLITVAVNEDLAGAPIQFSETRFAASRVEFSIASQG